MIPDRISSVCICLHLWLVRQKTRHAERRASPTIRSPAVSPVSRGRAASEAEAAAGAQRQPVPAAAGAGSRSIPRRPAPLEARRPAARGEPFLRHTSASSRVEGLGHTATLGTWADRDQRRMRHSGSCPMAKYWRRQDTRGGLTKILILQPLGASSACAAILFLSCTRWANRSRCDCARRRLCARRADSSCAGPGAGSSPGVGADQTGGSGCQRQTGRTDRERVQVGRRG